MLGLRRNLFREAFGGDSRGLDALRSRLTGASVSPSGIPLRDHRRAQPWLEAAKYYSAAGDLFGAYRRARAARAVEPELAAPYRVIGRTAQALGKPQIARLAFKRAAELERGEPGSSRRR